VYRWHDPKAASGSFPLPPLDPPYGSFGEEIGHRLAAPLTFEQSLHPVEAASDFHARQGHDDPPEVLEVAAADQLARLAEERLAEKGIPSCDGGHGASPP